MLRALSRALEHRRLLLNLTVRTLRLQYRQTVLGYAWIVLNPLVQLSVLYIVFGLILGRGAGIENYVVVLALGFFSWHLFSQAITVGSESLTQARNIFHPPSTGPLCALRCVLTYPRLHRDRPHDCPALDGDRRDTPITAVWIPIIFLAQLMFTIGLALPLAALNVYYHDERFLLNVVIRVWFWITPVFYTVKEVPERYRFAIDWNPLARFIDAYRLVLLSGKTPSADNLAFILVVPCVALTVGYYIFSKLEHNIVPLQEHSHRLTRPGSTAGRRRRPLRRMGTGALS